MTTERKSNLIGRILATLIDYIIYFAFFFFYVNHFGEPTDEGGKSVNGFMVLPINLAWLLYFVCSEAFLGATLGHAMFSLKVVNTDGTKASFLAVLKRRVVDPMDFFFFGLPAIIAIRSTPNHQRLGDLWAKTIVVQTDNQRNS